MKALKIIGIILLVLQVLSLIGTAMSGALFTGSIANLIGRLIFGIAGGVCLTVYAIKRKKK